MTFGSAGGSSAPTNAGNRFARLPASRRANGSRCTCTTAVSSRAWSKWNRIGKEKRHEQFGQAARRTREGHLRGRLRAHEGDLRAARNGRSERRGDVRELCRGQGSRQSAARLSGRARRRVEGDRRGQEPPGLRGDRERPGRLRGAERRDPVLAPGGQKLGFGREWYSLGRAGEPDRRRSGRRGGGDRRGGGTRRVYRAVAWRAA